MLRATFALLVLVIAFPALADPPPEAEQFYRDGQTAFDQAHYDDALASWQRSYDLSHAPALLYNIAQAYRLRAHPGDCAAARGRYQSFVDASEPSPQRSLAENYVAELATCASTSTHNAAATSDAESTREHSIRNRKIAVAAVGAGGVALLATGIYFGHHASALGDEVTSACSVSCDWTAESSKDAAGRRDATLGWTFAALGTAVLLGDAAFYWFGVRDGQIQVAPIAARGDATGAVLRWGTRW